jgi:aldehyde dehydrogenase (NAD+)
MAGMRSLPGNFVEPTIVRARNEWPIVQSETFAPILYLIPVASLAKRSRRRMPRRMGCRRRCSPIGCRARKPSPAAGSDCIANINLGTSCQIGGAFGEKDTGGGRESGWTPEGLYAPDQHRQLSRAQPLAQGIKL